MKLESMLVNLGKTARRETSPNVDVRPQVLETISIEPIAKIDIVPILFSSVAVAIAASLVVACYPSWETVLDPWANYFVQ